MIGSPFDGHDEIVTSLCFTEDSKSIASGSKDKMVKLIDLKTFLDFKVFTGH